MSMEVWLAFVLAATLVLIIPGPTIILVMSQAIVHGRRSVIPLVLGVALGDLTAMTLSLLGLGAVMATSAALFAVLKWIGVIYLIYLGISLFRTQPDDRQEEIAISKLPRRSFLKSAYIVTALNPKGIAFFVAFMPHFVSSGSDPFYQLVILGTTFLVLATINAAVYAIFAGQCREAMRNARIQKIFNRCGGSALIGAGLVTATLNRTS